jgi:hypothetical protein
MRRPPRRKTTDYQEYELKSVVICPEDVIVAVNDRPGRLALIHSKRELQEGDRIRQTDALFQLEEFVCATGFYNDDVQVWRVIPVGVQ